MTRYDQTVYMPGFTTDDPRNPNNTDGYPAPEPAGYFFTVEDALQYTCIELDIAYPMQTQHFSGAHSLWTGIGRLEKRYWIAIWELKPHDQYRGLANA